ncbi:11443_t:CDS:2 [Paraglomus brasilianum]|uniref:3-hydroxyisobutyrate dehydrogenase n=1 Tax=Paraglomus brasilianum TaxID=144538 RepID=A0A9N9GM50_9GLOM|nr:11443_t:CDS:2 [Paraglomus brasilianum]
MINWFHHSRSSFPRQEFSSSKKANSVGFIGLGQMGFKMAQNLYNKADSSLIIYDINKSATQDFISMNKTSATDATLKSIDIAESPVDIVRRASVVITMLPSSAHVEEVYLGKDGLVHGADKESLLIDSSTIHQSVSKEVAHKLTGKGATMVDAPVSGGTVGAEAATLTFMVGASSESDFHRAKPILSHMGKNIVHCGTVGTGQIAKMCNNMLLAISMIGVSEAMNLGIQLGMDPKLLASILNTSSGRCWSSDTYNPCPGVMPNVPSSRDYEGGFGNTLMAKDLRLAVSAASDARVTILLGAVAQQLYNQLANTAEYAKKDFSSIYKWLIKSGGK